MPHHLASCPASSQRFPLAAFALAWAVLGSAPDALAQASNPRTIASGTATLSILKGTVQRVPAAGGTTQAASDGQAVAVGDRILTGAGAEALLTFLDGSTLTIMPNADVAVKQATFGAKRSNVGIQINVGKVWARVVKLVDAKSSFSLESNTATATVHDGLIGAQQDPDGSFGCWTKAGGLTVTDRQGQTTVLLPGEKTTIKGGQAPAPQAFAVHQSAMNITATPNVLPLVLMDDQARLAGFVAPGIEINQVFGSYTGLGSDGGRTIEVPAGTAGPFTVILNGHASGPFLVTVTGLFAGERIYRVDLSGEIAQGERLVSRLTQEMDAATAKEPKTARVVGGSASHLESTRDPLPGRFVLSAQETDAARRP